MSTSRRRVLLLIDRLGRGGAAQVVLHVALTLDRARFSPIVCTTRNAPTYGQDDLLRRAGVPLIELNRGSRLQFSSWGALWQVLPTISLLHSHESGSNFWGRLWGQLFRVPVVITQEHTAADRNDLIVHLCNRLMSRLSDRIVTVSDFNRGLSIRLDKLRPDKVVTIYNGIDTNKVACDLNKKDARRLCGLPEDRWIVGVVARLSPPKNHQGLLRALTLLPRSFRSRINCILVGSGESESRLRDEVAKSGLQDTISFLGERTDVPAILKAVDLLVLPSQSECLPIVILEGLAAGCPIVATRVGGVPEMMDGLGWPLVTPDDSHGLAKAIQDVLRMPTAEQDRIAEAGRQAVLNRFTIQKSVAEVEALYDSLLTRSPEGSRREREN